MATIQIDSFDYANEDFVFIRVKVFFNTETLAITYTSLPPDMGGDVTEDQRARANNDPIDTYIDDDIQYNFYATLTDPYAYYITSEPITDPSPPIPPITSFEYQDKYFGDFCDKKGDTVYLVLDKRVATGSLPTEPERIIFAGEDNEPITISYKDSGEFKNTTINGSEAVLNLKAVEGFELSNLYSADETEWRVRIYGAFIWNGFIIPDSCSEPYASKPYDVTIRATDRVGTLTEVPFLDASGGTYKGFKKDIQIIATVLRKVGMDLAINVACNTYESTMSTSDSAINQTYANQDAFVDSNDEPLTCLEVLESILNRYSARLHQWNGVWQIVNVLEKSTGSVMAWPFNQIGFPDGSPFLLGGMKSVGEQFRDVIPTNAFPSIAKGIAASMAYYKYGYPSSELQNGDFDAWPVSTDPPTGWEKTGTMSITRMERLDNLTGAPTGDYYPRITANSASGSFLRNITPAQVIEGQKVQVSFDMYSINAFTDFPPGTNIYLGVQIFNVTNNQYYSKDGWGSAVRTYDVKFNNTEFLNQITVNFDVAPFDNDYDLKIGLRMPNRIQGDQFAVNYNNVKLAPTYNAVARKPPIGTFTRRTSKSFQTFRKEAIVILHGDEKNNQRTSQLSINSEFTVVPPTTWKRAGITEALGLLQILSDSELRQHQKPYRIFQADYVRNYGYMGDRIGINDLLNVDRLEGTYIFLSGEFRLKSCVDSLRHAQVFIEPIAYYEDLNVEDFGSIDLSTGLNKKSEN